MRSWWIFWWRRQVVLIQLPSAPGLHLKQMALRLLADSSQLYVLFVLWNNYQQTVPEEPCCCNAVCHKGLR